MNTGYTILTQELHQGINLTPAAYAIYLVSGYMLYQITNDIHGALTITQGIVPMCLQLGVVTTKEE